MNLLVLFIELAFQAYMILIVVRAMMPWFPHNRYDPRVSWIYSATDPVLQPIRRGLPPMKIGMDASPFVAIVLLWVIQKIIVSIL
jgi:YggT family protein